MKRKLFYCILCIFPVLLGFQTSFEADANVRLKSVFIYNFTRYIDWPSDYKTGSFVIAYFGKSSKVIAELNKMALSKTVGTQKIEIRIVTKLSEIGKANILYVSPDVETPLVDIIKTTKEKSILVVTESIGFAKKGATINFVIVDNRQKFELNQANAEKNHLKVSSSLLALAIPVTN